MSLIRSGASDAFLDQALDPDHVVQRANGGLGFYALMRICSHGRHAPSDMHKGELSHFQGLAW